MNVGTLHACRKPLNERNSKLKFVVQLRIAHNPQNFAVFTNHHKNAAMPKNQEQMWESYFDACHNEVCFETVDLMVAVVYTQTESNGETFDTHGNKVGMSRDELLLLVDRRVCGSHKISYSLKWALEAKGYVEESSGGIILGRGEKNRGLTDVHQYTDSKRWHLIRTN